MSYNFQNAASKIYEKIIESKIGLTRHQKVNGVEHIKAGFWIRFNAIWIDSLILIIGVKILFFLILLQPVEFYFPLQLTTFVAGIIYSTFFIARSGQTIGKKIYGITVVSGNNTPLNFFRIIIRETLGKIISGIFLFLGFIWIGITKSKLGWHDYLTGSQVLRTASISGKQKLVWFFIALLVTGLLLKKTITEVVTVYPRAIAFKINSPKEPKYQNRNESGLRDVSSLTSEEDSMFVNWLDINAKTPAEYAIEKAKEFQIILFGEMHDKKENLDFLNKIIPDLYYKAGVRCIAMECFPPEMNKKVKKLVTAKTYDRDLALEIARSNSWEIWVSKGYWDVFETVWKLNTTIFVESDKMNVVGISATFDGPSLALAGVGDVPIASPVWEKIRLCKLPGTLITLSLSDEIMAVNIEKEIIEPGKKAIVWIGGDHSYTHYAHSFSVMGKDRKFYRMGYLLHNQYGDKIFQILMHQWYLSPEMDFKGVMMGNFIERVMNKRSNAPVGFDLKDSPFANLRDSSCWYFYNQAKVNFNDVASGYIFLKPNRAMKSCEYMEGYISKEMFMRNKFFYENFLHGKREAGANDTIVKFRNSSEANAYYESIWNY